MVKCYICNENAEGSCYKCGQPICKGHLTIVNMTTYCPNCVKKQRALSKIGFVLLIAVPLIMVLVFSVSSFLI